MFRTKRVSTIIYILLQAFQNFPRFLIMISELISNLKYTFIIPFRINVKTIIMDTFFQFHEGAQLKLYPHLAQKYYTLLDWVQETFAKAWSSLLLFSTITETLMCNSIYFLISTLRQYGKSFSLSATLAAY